MELLFALTEEGNGVVIFSDFRVIKGEIVNFSQICPFNTEIVGTPLGIGVICLDPNYRNMRSIGYEAGELFDVPVPVLDKVVSVSSFVH